MKYFTVFTPTYNRAYILENAYNSLVIQSFKDFRWVIMDDGSSDDTETLVNKWISENKIEIIYRKQINGGRFVAHNNALDLFEGVLLVNLDSDDQMKPECLEELHNIWEKRNFVTKEKVVGIICYMQYPDGNIIGNEFPKLVAERNFVLRDKYGLAGDKMQVYPVELIKEHPYPVFSGEKFIGDSIVMNTINEGGKLLILRKALYIRDYPADSLTRNIAKTHYSSPKGMALYYRETIKYYKYNIIKRMAYAMKYVAFCRIAKEKIDWDIKERFIVFVMYIPGVVYAKNQKLKAKYK